jgi:transglutaminase-like putative cysteine protease
VNDPIPGRSSTALAAAALLITAAVNWHHLAWWCLPLLVLASAWHARAAMRGHALPGRGPRIGLTVIIVCGVLLSFRTLNGLAAGATLLAAMSAAKLFEARTLRDWQVLNGATLFLLLAACLDRQQLWRLPVYAMCLWLSASSLRGLGGGAALPTTTLLRESARQLLYAAPLAAILFLFFPRLPGTFWALPSEGTAITGLGNEMTPGDIAELVESDEPALRVRFAGALPPARERYWRGPVLHDFDGATWRRHRTPPAPVSALELRGPVYRYSATIEPNEHGTVIALEMSRPPTTPGVIFTDDFQLLTRRSLNQAQSYDLTAYPSAMRQAELSTTMRDIDLAIPANRNPRARDLALRMRTAASDDAAYVAAVLGFFKQGGFEYTLTPQRLGRDSIDELLFSTRQGFCGHYASAFVDLMRAGGVPARVVTGYQGGAWNPIGQYLNVRQSDAHAWAEVWLPGRGWLRADPTAMVSPQRLSRELLAFDDDPGHEGDRLRGGARWLATMLQTWDAVNAWWQDDVVGFNLARQLKVADWLGFGDRDWQTLAIAMGAGMASWLLWIAWSLRRMARNSRPDALARAWRHIDLRMTRAGHPRAAHEGVLAYCERLASTHPAWATAVTPLARQYARLRFGPPVDTSELHDFVRTARRFGRSELK